jgi:hypothetical protein
VNHYLKLVHYELFRIRKMYMALFAMTLLLQFAGLFLYAYSYLARAHRTMLVESISAAAYVARYGGEISFSRYTANSIWFVSPIAIGASVLLIYVFLIWYRDWFGKNMFIYRLLMIPTSRMNVYLAKLSAILLLVLGLVAFELLIIPLQNATFSLIVPSDFRDSFATSDIAANHPLLNILVPNHVLDFMLYYTAGVTGVTVVFTSILIERSYRMKGAIGGIAYAALAVLLLILPIGISESFFPNYLYLREIFGIELAVGLLIACGSLGLSAYLLKNKVTV